MTFVPGDDGFDLRRDGLLVALLANPPGPPLRWSGPGTFDLSAGAARVTIALRRPDAPGASIRLRTVSLTYRVEGHRGADVEGARRAVLAVCERLALVEEAPPSIDPRSLVGPAREVRRDAVSRWSTPDSEPPRGWPLCVDPALRPPFMRPAARAPRELRAPCDTCGARDACDLALVAPPHTAPLESGARAPKRLQPLRHAREPDAVDAALAAIAGEFGASVPAGVQTFLDLAYGARADGTLHWPLELSLKVDARGLEPRLRVVDYGPAAGANARDTGARREAVLASVRAVAAPEAVSAAEEFVSGVVGRHAQLGELSVGIDAPLLVAERPDPQIYVHVDPRDRRAMRAFGLDALAFAGCDAETRDAFVELLETPWPADDAERVPAAWPALTLVAHSPRGHDRARVKLYVTAPLAASHPRLAALPWEPGALATFAPRVGLAVFETDRGRLDLRKRDFPCLEHFQRLETVVDAFVDGAPAATAASVRALLDGRRFAAWPTWLSVAGHARTFYFVPR